MTALTADRNTNARTAESYEYPVAASVKCFAGALAVLDSSGNVKPGVTATGLIAVGRFTEEADNSSGGAAAINAKIEAGTFKWVNGSSMTKANIGDTVYVVDDQTVSHSSSGKSPAGILTAVDSDGVWVKTDPASLLASTGLLAANNLSDVGTAATARTNLGLGTIATQDANNVTISGGAVTGITDLAVADGGTGASSASAARTNLGVANKHVVQAYVPVASFAGAGAFRALAVAPVAGTISKIYSVLIGSALATGDATLTCKINGTSITTGVITVTQAGSAIGDKDSCTPSGLNTVAAGDVLEALVGGTNDSATCGAVISFEITEG